MRDLAAGMARLDPRYGRDVLVGAALYLALEDRLFGGIAAAWDAGGSSLRPSAVTPDRGSVA